MEKLRELLEKGIISDLLKAESALGSVLILGKNKGAIISLNQRDVNYSLAYFQSIAINEYVQSLARIFDRKSKRNKTRCIEELIQLLTSETESFPEVVEINQTKIHLTLYGYEYLLYPLENLSSFEFCKQLGMAFELRLEELSFQKSLVMSWRDKVLSHNDPENSVDDINFDEVQILQEFAWQAVTIVGWAFLSTCYGMGNEFHMRSERKRRANEIQEFLNRLI